MAFTTRDTPAPGFTNKGSALTWAEGDDNLIGLYTTKLALTGGTLTGSLNVGSGQILSGGTELSTLWGGGGGIPGGVTTQVQYNNGGVFGGSAGMVWNEVTSGLTINGSLEILGGANHSFRVDTDDIILGQGAGEDLDGDAGTYNTFIGYNAAKTAVSAINNVVIGKDAVSNGASAWAGQANVIIGLEAALSIIGGSNFNVIIGDGAARLLTQGPTNNIMIGRYAGYGVYNAAANMTLVGAGAGRAASNTVRTDNKAAGATYIGYEAGLVAAGAGNTAVGYRAGRAGAGSTSPVTVTFNQYNTSMGYDAGYLMTGEKNSLYGYKAGTAVTTGNGNVLMGCDTAASLTTGSSNIIIGDSVNVSGAGASGELRIGTGSTITISGNLATQDVTIGNNLTVTGHLAATTKSFEIDHPTQEGKRLIYGALEGPEHAVFVRGELKDNNIINLPEHWSGLVHEDSITVQLTAIGKPCIHYVEEIKDYNVFVGCEDGLPHCYYLIHGERKDVGKLQIEK